MKRNRSIAIAALLTLFFITRLINLTELPIFVDEGLHLSRALKIADSGDFLQIINGNGKYLPIWLYSFFVPHLPDPLWAGRFFAVLCGLTVVLGLIRLGDSLFSRKAGLMAAALYIIMPYTLFHDRLALVDTMLTALLILTIGATVQWLRTERRRWGVVVGLAIGSAAITKLYGGLLILIPLAAIFFLVEHNRGTRLKKSVWIMGVIAPLLWPIFTDLPKHLELFTDKSAVTVPQNTLSLILTNSLLVTEWFAAYFTPVGFGLIFAAIIMTIVQSHTAGRLLLSITVIWITFFVVISKEAWYPRYLLPVVPLLLLLTAHQIITTTARLRHSSLRAALPWGVVILVALTGWRFNSLLLTNPGAAPLPAIDRWQYIEGWPAGFGVRETAAYLHQQAQMNGQTIVVRDMAHGSLHEGLDLTLGRNEKLLIPISLDFNNINSTQAVDSIRTQTRPVYLVIDKAANTPLNFDFKGQIRLEPAAVFPKPGGLQQIEVYRISLP